MDLRAVFDQVVAPLAAKAAEVESAVVGRQEDVVADLAEYLKVFPAVLDNVQESLSVYLVVRAVRPRLRVAALWLPGKEGRLPELAVCPQNLKVVLLPRLVKIQLHFGFAYIKVHEGAL